MICDCFEKGEKNDYCKGTRDKEWCSCGGDKSKCDYYEHVREQMNDGLIHCLEQVFQRIENTMVLPFSDILILNIALKKLKHQNAEIEALTEKLKSLRIELERIALMTVPTDRKEMEGDQK